MGRRGSLQTWEIQKTKQMHRCFSSLGQLSCISLTPDIYKSKVNCSSWDSQLGSQLGRKKISRAVNRADRGVIWMLKNTEIRNWGIGPVVESAHCSSTGVRFPEPTWQPASAWNSSFKEYGTFFLPAREPAHPVHRHTQRHTHIHININSHLSKCLNKK